MWRCVSTSSLRKATARSSAAASACSVTICLSSASRSTNFLVKHSSGISICGSTAPCLMPALAWVSNALSVGFVVWNTSAKRFRSLECCIDSNLEGIMSKISILGVPMDLGADRRGVDMGPSALRYADLNEHLLELGHDVEDLGDLDVIIPETQHYGDPQAKYLKEIADACRHLGNLTLDIYERGRTPLVLGGDHSIAVGTVSGMAEAFRRQSMKLGLLWFDAHADMNTPQTSPSGNVHGMPMASILGYGPTELVDIFGFSPKLPKDRVVMVGIREVDQKERELVKQSGIRVFTMKEIDRRGIGSK